MRIIAEIKDLLQDSDGNSILSLIVKNFMFKNFLKSLDKTKTYSIEIKEVKSKRSLAQNRYLWALLSEMDKALNGGRSSENGEWELYINALERANIKYEYIACLPSAEQAIRGQFRAIKYSHTMQFNERAYNVYKCFIGSSKMNTKEFSELIDTILDMASEIGLDIVYWREVLR